MKTTRVTAAVFKQGQSVLLMRRGPNQPMAGQWEYPGGKFENGEAPAQCMCRELREELGITVTELKFLVTVRHKVDDDKYLELYVHEILSYTGTITMSVHDKMEWVDYKNLLNHSQLPADLIASRWLMENSK